MNITQTKMHSSSSRKLSFPRVDTKPSGSRMIAHKLMHANMFNTGEHTKGFVTSTGGYSAFSAEYGVRGRLSKNSVLDNAMDSRSPTEMKIDDAVSAVPDGVHSDGALRTSAKTYKKINKACKRDRRAVTAFSLVSDESIPKVEKSRSLRSIMSLSRREKGASKSGQSKDRRIPSEQEHAELCKALAVAKEENAKLLAANSALRERNMERKQELRAQKEEYKSLNRIAQELEERRRGLMDAKVARKLRALALIHEQLDRVQELEMQLEREPQLQEAISELEDITQKFQDAILEKERAVLELQRCMAERKDKKSTTLTAFCGSFMHSAKKTSSKAARKIQAYLYNKI